MSLLARLPVEILREIERHLVRQRDWLAWRSTCRRLRSIACATDRRRRLLDPLLATPSARYYLEMYRYELPDWTRLHPSADDEIHRVETLRIPTLAEPRARGPGRSALPIGDVHAHVPALDLDLTAQRKRSFVILAGPHHGRQWVAPLVRRLMEAIAANGPLDAVFHGAATQSDLDNTRSWIPGSCQLDYHGAEEARASEACRAIERMQTTKSLLLLQDIEVSHRLYCDRTGRPMLAAARVSRGYVVLTAETLAQATWGLREWATEIDVIVVFPGRLATPGNRIEFLQWAIGALATPAFEERFRRAWDVCKNIDGACLVLLRNGSKERGVTPRLFWYQVLASETPSGPTTHLCRPLWLLHHWFAFRP